MDEVTEETLGAGGEVRVSQGPETPAPHRGGGRRQRFTGCHTDLLETKRRVLRAVAGGVVRSRNDFKEKEKDRRLLSAPTYTHRAGPPNGRTRLHLDSGPK